MARKALTDGLIKFDETQGYRGAVQKLDISGDWGVKLADVKALSDVAVAARGRARGERSVGAHRAAARARAGRRGLEGSPIGIIPIDGVKWAKAAAGPDRGKTPARVEPGARPPATWSMSSRRQGRRQVPPAPDSGNLRRASSRWTRWTGRVLAMVGGFSFDQSQFNRATQALRQPGSVVQAVRLCGRARQRLHALDRRDGCADRDRHGSGRRVEAGKLFAQVLRPADAALRHRAFAQRDDGAARAGRRHAADRRICQALRRLRRHADLSVVRARRRRDHRDAHGDRPIRCSRTAASASSRR